MLVPSLGWEDSLEEAMATHSRILVQDSTKETNNCTTVIQRGAKERGRKFAETNNG